MGRGKSEGQVLVGRLHGILAKEPHDSVWNNLFSYGVEERLYSQESRKGTLSTTVRHEGEVDKCQNLDTLEK